MKPVDRLQAAPDGTSLKNSTRLKRAQTLAQRMSRVILAISVALCASSAIAQTSWQTVDDAEGSVYGMAADSLGNVFAAGAVNDVSGVPHGIISKSSTHTAGGETWIDYVAGSDEGQSISAITVADVITIDSLEHHLVAAGRDKAAETGGWIVRRSLDQAVTWVTLDRAFGGLSTAGPNAVALSNAGSIYAAGSIKVKVKASYVNQWLLRKGARAADGSFTWTTLSTPFDGVAQGVVCVGNDVFAVGFTNDSYWQVRKSSDGGATWRLVDNFRYQSQQPSSAWSVAADRAGDLYVVGRATGVELNQTKQFGVVRKGTSAGTVWTKVDVFNYGGAGYVWLPGVATDAFGKVHVVGSAPFPDSTVRQWFAREGSETSPGVWSWSTTDQFRFAAGYFATGQEIAVDPNGNVFTAGQANDSGIVHNWLVRRKLAP